MILFNPTKKEVEFRHGGKYYLFKPKESKNVSEETARHALVTTNTPLVKQTPEHDKEVEVSDVSYSEMPWKKLVQMASARGVFKPGTKRPVVEKALEEYDLRERGTL